MRWMESSPDRLVNLQPYITKERLLPLWIIQCGIIMGPLIFAIVVYALYRDHGINPPLPESGMRNVMVILSWVNIGLTSAGSFLVFLTYRFPDSLRWISRWESTPNDASPDVPLFRDLIGKTILRLALLEAPAMFGLVVCLIGVQTGVLYVQTDYWFNALPASFLVFYALTTLPTGDRVLAQLEQLIEIHKQDSNLLDKPKN